MVSGARTPMGGLLGDLAEVAATELGSVAIRATLEKGEIDPSRVDEVFMGCVLPAGLRQCPARQAMLGAGIPSSTGAVTVNKASIWDQGWSFTSRLLLGSSLVGLVLSLGLGVLAWRLFRWQSRNDHRMRTGRHLEGHRSWPDMT